MILPWLLTLAALAFFGWLSLDTLRELIEVEQERDALWDELHGVTATEPEEWA